MAVVSPVFFFYPLLYQMRFYALTRSGLLMYVRTDIKGHVLACALNTISHFTTILRLNQSAMCRRLK
jgi:hypothetical protein